MIYTESLPSSLQLFTPLTDFDGDFYDALFSIPYKILNNTEKAVMRLLAFHKFKGGACYPSHEQIAEKVNRDKRTVRRVLAQLDAKGFIQRIIPETWERRWRRWRNNYEFVWNEAYEAVGGRLKKSVLSSRLSCGSGDSTFNRDKEHKITTPAARIEMPVEDPKERTARYQTELDSLCHKISMRTNPAGSRFNPSAFRFKHVGQYGADAVKSVLEAILEKLESTWDAAIIKAFEWWGLGVDLLKAHKVINESTCTGWLGEDFKPPDKLPGKVADLLPGLVKSF